MSLKEYNARRDFTRTPEPQPANDPHAGALKFVVQRHQASSLHYDFRLEMGGVLKSWAVPKGPSLNPRHKRLAMMVEDHPYSYRTFEGNIPEGNYGAGQVAIWDEGYYQAVGYSDRKAGEKALLEGLQQGNIRFVLHGRKLQGEFSLVEMKGRQKNAWLLVKKNDAFASPEAYNAEDFAPGAATARKAASHKPAKAARSKTSSQAGDEMPHSLQPMMARLTDAPFDDADWIFETKWDGYRAIAEVRDGAVELYSRSGKSFRNLYKPIVAELSRLGHEAVLDGEVVVLDDQGHASFQALQNYQNTPHPNLYYYIFDLLYLDGKDLRERPLLERKQKLESLLQSHQILRYSSHVQGKGKAYFKQAQQNQVEGIMAKLASSPYRSGRRSEEWLKIKTHLRQEVVIGGFTQPKGSRQHLGALLLGVYEKDQLHYIGQSGSGFNQQSLKELKEKLLPLEQPESPFAGKVKLSRTPTWVRPELVCEISFAEWTAGGKVRQAIFEGLRPDKAAREVSRESMAHTPDIKAEAEATARPAKDSRPAKGSRTVSKAKKETLQEIGGYQVRLTSLDKPYWPKEKITKGDLIHYYQAIAPVLLPYLKDRPESLLRHPQGIKAAGFFQKDVQHELPDWIETASIHSESTDEQVRYLVCQHAAALAYMNNLGCIQLNPWNSRVQHLDYPDWAVIDLDPGENTYDEVVEVALMVKKVADAIGVNCYPKTSGATGMHIYFPLGAAYPFAEVKDFAFRFARKVHEQLPQLTSLERQPKERRNQVYLDYLQNAIGQTIAAPYCVRPRPGATVSAPLQWKEVKKGLEPKAFTLRNMPARIKKHGDLFQGVLGKGIDLKEKTEALKQLA